MNINLLQEEAVTLLSSLENYVNHMQEYLKTCSKTATREFLQAEVDRARTLIIRLETLHQKREKGDSIGQMLKDFAEQ